MPSNPAQLIGESPAFHWLMDRVSDAAALEKPVLVVGERGTGKELIASRLHFLSPRWEKTYLQVSCSAYTDIELDRLLFGEAFYDGRTDVDGQFVNADGGTLFLDNIESVPLRLQEKLLQALDYGVVDPVGSPETQTINVRLIASTGVDLPSAVRAGDFRADLLDHLSFDVVTLPPLRARRDDILALATYFARQQCSALGVDRFPGFSSEVAEFLSEQDWPGNIRELKTTVERTVGQAYLQDETLALPLITLSINPFETRWPLRGASREKHEDTIRPKENRRVLDAHPNSDRLATPPETVTLDTVERPKTENFSDRVLHFERRLIDEALSLSQNHQGHAAEYLDLSYHQFRGLLRKHGLKK